MYQLLKGLASIESVHSFYVLINKGSPLVAESWPARINLITLKSQWISFWEQKEIPLVLKRVKQIYSTLPHLLLHVCALQNDYDDS